MVATASSRGWGRGWPRDRSSEMRTVTAPSGARWDVHYDVAPILKRIVDEAERRGYRFQKGPRDVRDDWGYANRPISGTRVASEHSWGLAVDIDAQDYPQGQRRRVPPAWLIELFRSYRWEWGGNWSYADPMHFEFTGTRNDAKRMVAMLAGSPPVHVPPVVAPVPLPPKVLPVRSQISVGASGRLVEILQWELAYISGTQFPGEHGVYLGMVRDAVRNLGKILGKSWDGSYVGPDQWAAIDYLYLKGGHEPVVS